MFSCIILSFSGSCFNFDTLLRWIKMGACALKVPNPASISSQCVIFAESEMISLRAKGARANDGETVANIAAGVHYSPAHRENNLLGRLHAEPKLIFTGGVSKNTGMRQVLEKLSGYAFLPTTFDIVYTGALRVAVYDGQKAETRRKQGGNKAGNSVK